MSGGSKVNLNHQFTNDFNALPNIFIMDKANATTNTTSRNHMQGV